MHDEVSKMDLELIDYLADIGRLLAGNILGILTVDEEENLKKWIDHSDHNKALFDSMKPQTIAHYLEDLEVAIKATKRCLQEIKQKLSFTGSISFAMNSSNPILLEPGNCEGNSIDHTGQ